jgi:hypothetical protein
MRELLLSEMLDGDVVDTAHVKEDFPISQRILGTYQL